MGMRRLAVLIAPLALLGLLAACGDDASTVSSGGSTSSTSTTASTTTSSTMSPDGSTTAPPTTARPSAPPAHDGDVAIEIRVGGGFVPQGLDFSSVPTIVLADGRAFIAGAQTMQYPGPALSPVGTGRLGAGAVQQLLDAAKAAGLDGRTTDFGQPSVADAATTTIRVAIDGREHTTAVYALDLAEGGGVSRAQAANRQRVSTFVDQVGDVVGRAATTPLQPTGYEVLGFESSPAAPQAGEPAPNDLDWPFPELLITGFTTHG